MARCFVLGYLLLCLVYGLVGAERIKDMIYMSLDGAAACFRKHNGTHQFGCSSSRSGSVGVVHILEVQDDIRWIEQNATAGPYTVVLSFPMFTKDNLHRLRDTNNINGILLARNLTEGRPFHYSPEDECPNRYSGYKTCNESAPWNSFGSALLMEDWPFPMFYTENETLLEAIKTCFWEHNAHDMESQAERSLCAIEMKSFMFAAINSESCIRRGEFQLNLNPMQYCDPLGDRNIHWPLSPLSRENNNSVILVTGRLDAASLFDGISPGAGNVVTGLVTFLATAYYLNFLNATVDKTNVIFSLLNGEAFDYIGSSRLVYDLKNGHFNALGGVNLKFEDVQCVIEFGQLGVGDVFLHASNLENDPLLTRLKDALAGEILDGSVPPTSVQSFLEESSNLSAVVISNHGKQFANRYYNGILDDAQSVNFNGSKSEEDVLSSTLAKIAISVAGVLYRNVTGNAAPSVSPEDQSMVQDLVAEMLDCYLQSAECNLFRAALSPGSNLVNQVLPLYVGVHGVPNVATTLTGQLLSLLTAERLTNATETTCHEKHLAWLAGYNFTGLCVNSTVNYSAAMSPAFIIDGYDMKSGLYSTWTESVWQTLGVRMFLKPSAATERFSMILGSVVAGTSFVLVWFINSRADVLFNSRRAASS